MKIVLKKLADLKLANYNPRVHSKEFLENLGKSIKEFGFLEPIVWNQQTGHVVGGHARLKVLLAQGVEEAEVSVVDLPLAKEKLLNLALNKVVGEWDEDLLAPLLKELYEGEVDLDLSGFDEREVEKLIGGLYDIQQDEVPPLPVKPKSKRGEVYQLGNHFILCGDSTCKEDVDKLMAQGGGGIKTKLLLTDPPYAVAYVDKARDMNKLGYVHSRATLSSAITGDEIDEEQAERIWSESFTNALQHCDKNVAIYAWHASGRAMRFVLNLMHKLQIFHHQTLIWKKTNFVIGRSDYQPNHETCFYGWLKGSRPPFYGEKNQTTVWECATPQDRNHPTQKPVELMLPPIRNHLKEGEVCLDPFLGSGTTLIACEQTNRVCFGCDIEPQYIDVCIQRFVSFKGSSEGVYRLNKDGTKTPYADIFK